MSVAARTACPAPIRSAGRSFGLCAKCCATIRNNPVSPKHPPRAGPSRRLTVLSPAERLALYEVPDFDAFQRAEYFALTSSERALAERRKGAAAQLHCMLQIGYFKAKRAFFSLSASAVPAEDVAFLAERYFPANPVMFRPVTAYEQYA